MAHRVCPWWLGYFLLNPLRRFAHDPARIVGPYLKPGMTVVDFGGDFAAALKPGGRLLAAEPVLHVRKQEFERTVATAERAGFTVIDRPQIKRARAVLLQSARARENQRPSHPSVTASA
jgi:hypothetical protein